MANRMHMKVRHTGLGPGGWNCHCCAPRKGMRKIWCPMAKRIERREANASIAAALKD